MNATFEKLATEFANKLIVAFAAEVAKHELKKNMSQESILELIGFNKSIDDDATEEDIEITKDELPQGISIARAKAILKICKKGVPDGEYVHVTSQKIMTPTEQQKTFYRNEDARIFGPQKQQEVIDFLAEKAGTVTAPPEEEIEPALPSNWTPKNVKKLLERVAKCPEEQMINPFTSRRVEFKPATMIKRDEYVLCAQKKDKQKFAALVAYLDEQDEWQEIERKPDEPSPPKGKAAKKGKAEKKAKKEEAPAKGGRKAKPAPVEEEDETIEDVKPSRKAKEEVAKPSKRKAAKKESVDDDGTEEVAKPAAKGRKPVIEEPEGTSSDDEDDDEHDSEDRLASAGEIDYDRLREILATSDIKEDEYVNIYTGKVSKLTPELSKTHAFDCGFHIYAKAEKSARATAALLGRVRRTLQEMEENENKEVA